MNTEIAKDQLNKIVDLFSSQKLPAIISKTYLESAGKPCDKWSLGNQILMIMSETTDARGYRQWQEIGRYVKKGSRAIYILSPCTTKIKKVDKQTNEEKEEIILTGFRGIPVFRYEDTDGKPIKSLEPRKLPPLIKVAEHWGVKVVYSESTHGEYGSFSPQTNTIRLSTHSQDTFFHELAHRAHSQLEKLKDGQDPEQETIAQLTACVLCELYGIDAKSYSYTYIAHYANSAKPENVGRMCLRVLGKVQKILNMILETDEQIKKQEKLIEVKTK